MHLNALSFEIKAGLGEIQLFPAGTFATAQGQKCGPWVMDEATANALIAQFDGLINPLAVDYEHQTLIAKDNGKPAPAAGWITELIWRAGQGLFATVEWTQAAAAAIKAREYRFISPVFHSDGPRILSLGPAALTNFPALDGMAFATAARALNAQSVTPATPQPAPEKSMEELLKALRAQLGLADDATPEVVLEAFNKWAATLDAKKGDAPQAMSATFAAMTALTAQVHVLSAEVVALRAMDAQTKIEALVQSGLADGRLVRGDMEAWARSLDEVALSAFLGVAQPIAALSAQQSAAAITKPAHGTALTAIELEVCARLGVSKEVFIKQRGA